MDRIDHNSLGLATLLLFFTACAETHSHDRHPGEGETTAHAHEPEEGKADEVHFSSRQFEALEMAVGPLPRRTLSSIVEANGELEVPPQNEATVTALHCVLKCRFH